MNEIYLVIAAAIGGFLTKGTEWVFNRGNAAEEVKGKEIDNEVKLADYYKSMLDDLEVRYDRKYQELGDRHEKRYESMSSLYEDKERVLRDEIVLLKNKVRMLKTENAELRKRVRELEERQ